MSATELEVINPYTEKVELTLPLLSPADVNQVVARARGAFEAWRWTPMVERASLCERFVAAFEAMAEEAALDITRQMGKPIAQARGEVQGMLGRARHMIAIAGDVLKDEYVEEKPGFVRYIRHEPLGVVLDVAAWNYPLLIAVNVVVPAVLAGNAVILKHSSRTPLCGLAFEKAFAAAGAPDGLVQSFVADHFVTDLLICQPKIDFVSFTGSVRGGHEVVRSAAGRFIGMGLELGGKDPAYVCADANFDYAVENTVDGALYNAGQSCCAVERIYVERSIYDRFVEAYAAKTRAYAKLGDPMDTATTQGPMATPTAARYLRDQVDDAVRRGGTLVVDPASYTLPKWGWFAAPAVVANPPQSCSLMQEESFGPVVGIIPVDSDAEAIRLMNDSAYGLTASIWTSDATRAAKVGAQVETGTFFMNRCDFLDPALPWTGVKDTGRGATLSHYGLLQLTQLKSMHLRTQV